MKIMIVDDNFGTRALIRELVCGPDCECVEFSDGREAVEAFGSEKPDWVVMDLTMKVMDGFTATRLITSRYPDSKVVIITQHSDPKLGERARHEGACAFVHKEDLIQLRQLASGPKGIL